MGGGFRSHVHGEWGMGMFGHWVLWLLVILAVAWWLKWLFSSGSRRPPRDGDKAPSQAKSNIQADSDSRRG